MGGLGDTAAGGGVAAALAAANAVGAAQRAELMRRMTQGQGVAGVGLVGSGSRCMCLMVRRKRECSSMYSR